VRLLELIEPSGLIESRQKNAQLSRSFPDDRCAARNSLNCWLTLARLAPFQHEAVEPVETPGHPSPLDRSAEVGGRGGKFSSTHAGLKLPDLELELRERTRPILRPRGEEDLVDDEDLAAGLDG
jgi:hypothetical protein